MRICESATGETELDRLIEAAQKVGRSQKRKSIMFWLLAQGYRELAIQVGESADETLPARSSHMVPVGQPDVASGQTLEEAGR